MAAIGETLRRERLKRNLELEAVSRELKISHKFLEAIEDERFEELPRGVFAKSFVRQYARLLGLDEAELANEVQRVTEPASGTPAFAHPEPEPAAEIRVPRMEAWQNVGDNRRSWLPALAMLVFVMTVCGIVKILWDRMHQPPTQTAAVQAPQTPNRLPHNDPASVSEPPQPAPAPQTHPANSADRPVGDNSAKVNPSPASTATPQSAQVAIPNANPQGPVQVEVSADELVWIEVRSDGKVAFSGTLDAHTTRSFGASDKVMVKLGNAGGVSMKLNGQPVGPVGPKGQIRTVQFTSGGFQIVAPAPPKPVLPPDDRL